MGTTQGDYFYGELYPAHGEMTPEAIGGEYEKETGTLIIAEAFEERRPRCPIPCGAGKRTLSRPLSPGARTLSTLLHNAVVLEKVAFMDVSTLLLARNPSAGAYAAGALLDRHYLRKHGANAYYGQK